MNSLFSSTFEAEALYAIDERESIDPFRNRSISDEVSDADLSNSIILYIL